MGRPRMHDKTLSEDLLNRIKDQASVINELANNINLELGEANPHAKKLTALNTKFASLYTELTIFQSMALENDTLKDSKTSNLNLAKNSHPKKERQSKQCFC
jgi:hypothetical protein